MIEPHDRSGRQKTSPVPVRKTMRRQRMRNGTSIPAGKVIPLDFIPLLREDCLKRAPFTASFEMHETAQLLWNSVNVSIRAHLVPFLAMDRFEGLDDFNRAYTGEANKAGEDPVDFFNTVVAPAAGTNEIFKYAGRHTKQGDTVNDGYIEAYNQVWNYRARELSPDLEERSLTDTALAPAFWNHSFFKHIVPDFDQAKIDGEVALSVANARMPVSGIGRNTNATPQSSGNSSNYKDATGATFDFTAHAAVWDGVGGNQVFMEVDPATNLPNVFAELEQNGITISLSNIELARKTQAWAEIRKQYNQHSEEYLIELLMDGIRVPTQALRQPMLIGQADTVFGMSQRYSSSSGALDETAVNGLTQVQMNLRTPQSIGTGGIIVITAEILPEQLWERQQDPFLYATTPADLPQHLRDELDPEKVEVVQNRYVDVMHTNPNDTFGYAPLNHKWNMDAPHIGGRYFRPDVNTQTDDDRQKIWAVENVDPTLGDEFYIAEEVHTKVFADTANDPFEVMINGMAFIEGNTVFGHMLEEATDDYEQVAEEAPTELIDKD